jgi:hypothetical protein
MISSVSPEDIFWDLLLEATMPEADFILFFVLSQFLLFTSTVVTPLYLRTYISLLVHDRYTQPLDIHLFGLNSLKETIGDKLLVLSKCLERAFSFALFLLLL